MTKRRYSDPVPVEEQTPIEEQLPIEENPPLELPEPPEPPPMPEPGKIIYQVIFPVYMSRKQYRPGDTLSEDDVSRLGDGLEKLISDKIIRAING